MSLRVVVDGTPMPPEAAKAMWGRFSTWMEEHRGDLAGFARSEALASVHPEMHDGEPVLVASRTVQQGDYVTAPKRRERPAPGTRGKSRR